MLLVFFTFSATFSTAEDLQLETEDQILIPLSDIPEVLTMQEVTERGHTKRLRNEETDMHSVIFQNQDGTKSLYVFASPVKYEATDGAVKDKRTTITQTLNAYSVTDNDVQMSFGNSSSDGATLEYENASVSLIPSSNASASAILSNNTMMYNNAFSENTLVAYTPLLSGVKSSIIIKEPIANNSFTYTLNTSGISSVSKDTDGVIKLSNSDNETLFKIGIFIVTDANGNITEGEMQLNQDDNGNYSVTATVDDTFLSAEDIAYPIMVEPTITVNTSSAINDAVIYSNKPNKNYGAYNYHNVGKVDDSYGTGRLLVSFPGLESNTTYQSLFHTQIRKAEFNVYCASDSDMAFHLKLYRQNIFDWSEKTITWNQAISYTTVYTDDVLMLSSRKQFSIAEANGGDMLSLNITSIIKDGVKSLNYLDRGVIIQNTNEKTPSFCADLCSTEYADSHGGNYMPYVTIEYADRTDYIPINITIYIDNAFVTQCRLMNVSIQSRLDTLMSDAVAKFRNFFGIEISYSYVFYQTPIDSSDCPAKASIFSLCDCYDLCFDYCNDEIIRHHTNQWELMKTFPESDTNVSFNMFMTGRKTCDHNADGTCKEGSSRWGICIGDNLIGIFCTYQSGTIIDEKIQEVILHEIGHLYGVPDHYGEDDEILPGMSDSCIYGINKDDSSIINGLKICEYCTHVIDNNVAKYYHE